MHLNQDLADTWFREWEVTQRDIVAWRVKDKGFLRIRSEAEGGLVVFVADLGEKEALLQSDPEKFFTTPHYDGYPTVLVNLKKIRVKELRELIHESWRIKAPKTVLKKFGDQVT